MERNKAVFAFCLLLVAPWSTGAAQSATSIDPQSTPVDLASAAEDYRRGQRLLRDWADIEPFLPVDAEPDESLDLLAARRQAAERELSMECLVANRRCLAYLRGDPESARLAVPDNPAYWSALAAALGSTPLATEIDQLLGDDRLQFDGLIAAARLRSLNALLHEGRLDAATVHDHVAAHRRLLAQSGFLIEKMIFLASTGVALQEVNLLMAQGGLGPQEQALIDLLLRPVSQEERSLRRALAAEYRSMEANFHNNTDAAALTGLADPLGDVQRLIGYVSDRSELGWEAFWRDGMDALQDVEDVADLVTASPSYKDYVTNLHGVDASLYLLRALRPMYEGRETPGLPAAAPPPYWQWRWDAPARELCLEPVNINSSLQGSYGWPGPVCMEYLREEAWLPAGRLSATPR